MSSLEPPGEVGRKILVVEDEKNVSDLLQMYLRKEGFRISVAPDGSEALRLFGLEHPDLVILDLMLPKLDGLTLLRRLREQENPVHVLILTARDTVDDRVQGLNLGADDYLVKPFAFEELLARVCALVRRKYEAKSPVIRVADLEIDTVAGTVRRAGRRVSLTPHEYALLKFLALQAGVPLSRTQIWEHLYDFAADPNSNVIDVHIGRLRRKLESGGQPRLIHTRRGLGYVLGESD